MAKSVNERSPLYMTMVFTDEVGDPLIPTTVEWRLDDKELNAEIVDWTLLGSPAATMNMVIPATYNEIVNEDKVKEKRIFGIRVNVTLNSEAHAELQYAVLNLTGPLGVVP